MNKLDDLQKALDKFPKDAICRCPDCGKVLETSPSYKQEVWLSETKMLFSCFEAEQTAKEQALRKLLKTLPTKTGREIREFCSCEWTDVEVRNAKKKWVSVETVTALLLDVFREKTIAEEKNVEYAKLVAHQAEEYAEKLRDKVLVSRKQLEGIANASIISDELYERADKNDQSYYMGKRDLAKELLEAQT